MWGLEPTIGIDRILIRGRNEKQFNHLEALSRIWHQDLLRVNVEIWTYIPLIDVLRAFAQIGTVATQMAYN